MENKINIAELLRDCPRGMELDCTIWGWTIEFDHINIKDEDYPIVCHDKWPDGKYNIRTFTKYGYCSISDSECVIFPKGKTTWEGFQRPFKDGDVVVDDSGAIFIYKQIHPLYKAYADFYCGVTSEFRSFVIKAGELQRCGEISSLRYATEEEKQKLFDAIKANGYRWNAETKTLEKLPKFKVGDRIKHKTLGGICCIKEIRETCYMTDMQRVFFEHLDNFELVEKFDISTLKPFESRVLVKTASNSFWMPSFFGFYRKEDTCPFICCNGFNYKYCIPYENNEHLLGTTNDCDDFYKTWE